MLLARSGLRLRTQRGRVAVVMVSMQAYEESQHELDILRLLARGEKEIEAGAATTLTGC